MLKKIMIFMMSMCVVTSSASFAFASDIKENNILDNNQYEINNIESFKSEINSINDINNLSEKEKSEILSKVNPNVVEEFIDEKIEKLEDMQSEINNATTPNKTEIDLGDNCKVIVTTTDEQDNLVLRSALKATPGAETTWKDFGACRYTVKYELNLAVLNATLKLVNRYYIDKNGIKLNLDGCEADVENPSFLGVNFGSSDAGSIVAVSSNASKAGKSVKISCIYKFSYQLPFGAETTKKFKLYSDVKYSQLDLAGKQMKVVQSWSGDWM